MTDTRAEVLRMADAGAPTNQITAELGICRQYVAQILKEAGYVYCSKMGEGEAMKVDQEVLQEDIRVLGNMAEVYGMHSPEVYQLFADVIWKLNHVFRERTSA